MASVKWLASIEVLNTEFHGYQMKAYRFKKNAQDVGVPCSRIKVRSLMIPPGVPDFWSRVRFLQSLPVTLSGRAWAGGEDIVRVEVSVDGGTRWKRAELQTSIGKFAWVGWSFEWSPSPGRYTLRTRAADVKGRVQDDEDVFNYFGMGCTVPQWVEVVVHDLALPPGPLPAHALSNSASL